MTAKKKRRQLKPKSFVRGATLQEADVLADAFATSVAPKDPPVAPVEDNRPHRVVLDNNVPGGFRMEPV